jgi:hypothetical protein
MNEVRENFQQSFDQGDSPDQTILRLENKSLVTGNIRDNTIAGMLSIGGKQCDLIEESVANSPTISITT